MAKVHDKFVIELAEVIKGYGNDPDVDDPFHLSEFYRFYELPEIAVSTNNFKAMIPLADVQPVVRCRNCEHWDDMYGTCYCEDFEVHCQDYYIGDMHTEPDFFCGFGERKGEDNEID